jgi:hypothetical protein
MAVAGLLWCSVPTWAQVQMGNQLALSLGGNISAGYSGSFGNQASSSDGVIFGGNADVAGSYHSSQFLSFDFSPFYNQSRNDSTFQSITDSSGLTANTTLFGGSKFPGYVNYSKMYNTEGNYFLPGVANYKTNADSQSFGVGWSLNLKDLPTLSVGYQDADSNYSIYGEPGEGYFHSQSFFANSSYTLAGFRLGGGYHYTDTSSTFPQLLTGQSNQQSQSNTSAYTFNLSHSMILDGTSWLSFSRNTTTYNVLGSKDSETADVVTGGFSLKPTDKLSASFNADYDNNLAGTIYQAENSAGVLVPVSLPADNSYSWGVFGQTQYNLTNQFYVGGNIAHLQQQFLGKQYESNSYSGDVNYGRQLWGGRFSTGTTVTESSLTNNGGSLLGILSNVIYIRRIGAWNVNSSLGYSRNSQTLLVAYTTSGYNFSGSVSRRIRTLIWNGSAAGSKSVVNQLQGTSTLSQSYTTGLSNRRLGVSAGYAHSSGLGLYTSEGISSLPAGLPPSLLPSTVLYGGTTYSASVGGSPIHGLTFNGTYSKTRSNTVAASVSSNNDTDEANVYLQYKFRKVFFTAGYSRLVQGFSASTAAPAMVSTYYVGLSRWFNFF